MEKQVASNSSMCVRSTVDGVVTFVDCKKIVINDVEHYLSKLIPLNDKSALNHRPVVKLGQSVVAGDVIADGPSTQDGELALGKNVLVGFVSWKGHNFEDAIIVSEELIRRDVYFSSHC